MTTSHIVRRAALTAAVAGVAALTTTPASAKPGPIDYGSLQDSSRPTKAQIEHDEAGTVTGSSGLAPHLKARVEQMERATADQQPAVQPARSGSSDSSSFPVAVLALVGGGLVAAGAGGVTVYRFRHHGTGESDSRVGTATA